MGGCGGGCGVYESSQPRGMVSSLAKYAYLTYEDYAKNYNWCELNCVKTNVSDNPVLVERCKAGCYKL